jgi:pyruvate/2-oxoglutarate dehydrogenase complex dihydrolipoamide acyltransferase (E2) component
VLAKTALGIGEIKSRTHGLSQKLRSILITVDGQATVGDLIAKFGALPEIAASLDGLVSDGFVEVKAGKGAAAAALAPAAPRLELTQAVAPIAAPRQGPAPSQTREQALSALTRFAYDHLGPDADLFTGALERARTRVDFVDATERCARAVASVRGAAKAQAFRERATVFAEAFFGG